MTPGNAYTSGSQKSRVISEYWYEKNVYCFACDSDSVVKTKNNTKGNDFICPNCDHHYELKTFQRRPSLLPDGAFATMIEKIEKGTVSTFCLLQRDANWRVQSLTAIHSSFMELPLIHQRPPLLKSAERAGWIGCDIKLNLLQPDAEIPVIQSGKPLPAAIVRKRFKRFLPLARKPLEVRGWTLLTMKVVRSLGKIQFSLKEMYELEGAFRKAYPDNLHIKDKIRQQLQMLRDMGWLRFDGRGNYTIVD